VRDKGQDTDDDAAEDGECRVACGVPLVSRRGDPQLSARKEGAAGSIVGRDRLRCRVKPHVVP
jgi:hypothetical protein